MKRILSITILDLLWAITISQAQDTTATNSAAKLAQKLANPIASLISVPLQNNTDYGIGDYHGSRNTLNIQPVIPFKLTSNLNLITRVILPVVTQYNVSSENGEQSGLGDAVVSTFFSPSNTKNGLTWGVGPVFLVPIATNSLLGTEKFGLGPTAVALKQTGGWTLGGLANQIWSVAGSEDRAEVSQLFLQPFINFNFKSGAGLGANSEITVNWETNTTVATLNLTASAVTKLGNQTTQFALGPRIPLASPSGSRPDWGWRAVLVFLFPK